CGLLLERRPRALAGDHARGTVRRMKSRGVTIVVHVDGDLDSRQYRVPQWAFEAGRWGAVAIALLVVLFFAFAEPLTHAAARVPGLEQEVARLQQENGRVQKLASALNRAEANYQELRQLLGVRSPPEKGVTPAPSPDLPRAVAVRPRLPLAAPPPAPPGRGPPPPPPPAAARPPAAASVPPRWPLHAP